MFMNNMTYKWNVYMQNSVEFLLSIKLLSMRNIDFGRFLFAAFCDTQLSKLTNSIQIKYTNTHTNLTDKSMLSFSVFRKFKA